MNVGKVLALSAVVLTMAVPSFAQQQGRGRGGFGRGGGNILSIPEVQAELKLDDAQKDLIQQLNMEMRQKRQALFQNGGGQGNREENMKKFQELQAEQDKKAGEILKPEQVVRYKQLQIQQLGTRALDRADVAAQLKLTGDQKNQIATTIQGERAALREAFQNGQNGGDRQAAIAKLREMRSATDTKLMGILTDTQKAQFEKMKGAAFTFPQRQRGNGGNANGNGNRRRNRAGNA